MTGEYLRRVLVRDLAAVRLQLQGYENEKDIWILPDGIKNSAGTLALHLAGNIQYFIGAQLGDSSFVRDRDTEFTMRNVSRADLDEGIQQTIDSVNATFDQLQPADMDNEYPLELAGVRLQTGLFLTHLATHLAYHLGQMDYHRRVITKGSDAAGAQSIPALASG